MNEKYLIRKDLSALVSQYPSNLIYKKLAFTLAEVLITLGIIGVVAALTLPTLIQKYQKQQAVTQLKATYTILAQAFEQAQADYGDVSTWGIDAIYGQDANDNKNREEVGKNVAETYLLPYIKPLKNYALTSLQNIGYSGVFNLDGTIDNYSYSFKRYTMVLTNGAIVAIGVNSGCAAYKYDENGNKYCSTSILSDIYIITDINGLKKPNTMGKDVFVMQLNSNKFDFYKYSGGADTRAWIVRNACTKGSNENRLCGRLIQLDGWEIKSDYPW